MDQYLNSENTYQRLLSEYEKYGSLVVAYDFDNTVYDFHKVGNTYTQVINLLRALKSIGCYLIIFTANEDQHFVEKYCEEQNIPYDAINQNPPFYSSKARKIYYNILLDYRAGLKEAYDLLNKLVNQKRIDHDESTIIN